MKSPHVDVRRRDDAFAQRTTTRIWQETPSPGNPYLATSFSCYGYDLLDLVQNCTYIEVFFLLFRGELPSPEESRQLEALMVALINPGPRHPATRAAMCAGVGKTETVQTLPIALTVMGGDFGAGEVEDAMRFLRKERKKEPAQTARGLMRQFNTTEGDIHLAPGFGSRFGGADPFLPKLAETLLDLPGVKDNLSWGQKFVEALNPYGIGWLPSGLAAAVFADLGFHPRSGPGLMQLLCAPGLLAHSLELANKPITAMPFVKDEDYIIER